MTKKRTLEYYGGQGYGYSNEIGKFEVISKKSKFFTKLSEAKKYYESLNEGKSIWDITRLAELIECHYYEREDDFFNNKNK